MARHDWRRASVDLPGYLAGGLPSRTMGRTIVEDPLFFGAALAGGTALADLDDSGEEERGTAAESWLAPPGAQGLGGESPSVGDTEPGRNADGERLQQLTLDSSLPI